MWGASRRSLFGSNGLRKLQFVCPSSLRLFEQRSHLLLNTLEGCIGGFVFDDQHVIKLGFNKKLSADGFTKTAFGEIPLRSDADLLRCGDSQESFTGK